MLHAIEILRTDGLVFTVARRGTYVSAKTPNSGRKAHAAGLLVMLRSNATRS